jgi:hypothetical protein
VVAQYGPNIVVIVGHGKTFNHIWAVYDSQGVPSPVEWVVDVVRKEYPDRLIFVFVCNPDGITLDRPNVLYGKQSLWLVPDRLLPNHVRDHLWPETIGSVSELTYNP